MPYLKCNQCDAVYYTAASQEPFGSCQEEECKGELVIKDKEES